MPSAVAASPFAGAIALNRFGLGARPGDAAALRDPQEWLRDQISRPAPIPSTVAALTPGSTIAARTVEAFASLGQARRKAEAQGAGMTPAMAEEPRTWMREAYAAQTQARITAALATEMPVQERLTHFWANHFAVSANRLGTIATAGVMEAESIRPYVMGRFADMLLAVVRSPAMLLYLDQVLSAGPDSRFARLAARRRARKDDPRRIGLNENLAREILELHTLGVRSGYSQADVTELARALTGWTLGGYGRLARLAGTEPGRFAFVDGLHEPGSRTVLGRRYAQDGEDQARAILLDLARHPATARHVATRLARHFVADEPPPALVEKLAGVFRASDGDLPSLYRALVDAPDAWAQPLAKFKTPWDMLISALRACGVRTVESNRLLPALQQMGQRIWLPGSPAGWPDTADAWAGPDALMKRVEFASALADRTPATDVRQLAEAVLPGTLGARTRSALAQAESSTQAMTLLLVSPEFLRR